MLAKRVFCFCISVGAGLAALACGTDLERQPPPATITPAVALDLPGGSEVVAKTYAALPLDREIGFDAAANSLGLTPFRPDPHQFQLEDELTRIDHYPFETDVLVAHFTDATSVSYELRQAAREFRSIPPRPPSARNLSIGDLDVV
jgi:hypothetical protein